MGTTDLDFHTVVGDTFYRGLLIICFGTATILTIWIKVTNVRCQLPKTHDIGIPIIRTTRNLDSILLNIFLVSLIILNTILFNSYYKGYFFLIDLSLPPEPHQFWFWFSPLFNPIFQSFDGKTQWIPCLVRPLFWSDTSTNASFSGDCN